FNTAAAPRQLPCEASKKIPVLANQGRASMVIDRQYGETEILHLHVIVRMGPPGMMGDSVATRDEIAAVVLDLSLHQNPRIDVRASLFSHFSDPQPVCSRSRLAQNLARLRFFEKGIDGPACFRSMSRARSCDAKPRIIDAAQWSRVAPMKGM